MMFKLWYIFMAMITMASGVAEAKGGVSAVASSLGGRMPRGTVTLEEKRDILITELARTLVERITAGGIPAVQELGEQAFEQKKEFMMGVDDDELGFHILGTANGLRESSATMEKLVDKEVLGELTEDDLRSLYAGTPMEESFADASDTEIRDRIQGIWHEISSELDRMESIDAMEDATEQRQAFADYTAGYDRSGLVAVAITMLFEKKGILTSSMVSDARGIVELAYLSRLHVRELEKLAQMLGRDDLAAVETEIDRDLRKSRERREMRKEILKKISHKRF